MKRVLLLALVVTCAADSGAEAADAAFANVAEPSGVAAAVKAHYERVPKWWLSGFDLIDVDGDGDLDLHVGGHGSPAAAAINDGKGHFTYVDPKLDVARGVRHAAPLPYPGGEIRLAHDFDEDGKVDILASWHDGGGVLYLNVSGTGGWNFTRPRTLDHFNRACAVADVDRDGVADYLADEGGRANPGVVAFFGSGDGTFPRHRVIAKALRETCPIPVDLDGDGDLDFLLSRRGYNPPGRRVLRNDGGLRFTDVTKQAGLSEDGGSIHGAGDVDHDGDLDLICVEGRAVVIYANDGTGRFESRPGAVAGIDKVRNKPGNTNWGGAVVTDIDNDGVADILVSGRHFLYVLRGTGGGRFEVANAAWGLPTTATAAVDEGLCFGDIDGDGDLDFVTCGPGPTPKAKGVAVFRNDLPSRRWLRVRPIGKRGNRAAAGATIRIYEAGGLGDPRRLLWHEQVAVWGRQSFHSYYAAAATERHFGLGDRAAADVRVVFHHSGKCVDVKAAKADSTVEIREQ